MLTPLKVCTVVFKWPVFDFSGDSLCTLVYILCHYSLRPLWMYPGTFCFPSSFCFLINTGQILDFKLSVVLLALELRRAENLQNLKAQVLALKRPSRSKRERLNLVKASCLGVSLGHFEYS